jgi:hypothetical protein
MLDFQTLSIKCFFFPHIDCFRLRAISLDSQNRIKAFSQKNDRKPIGLLCFQKVYASHGIAHSLIKVEQLDKVLFAGSFFQ